jgi:hypothetical protein
MTRTLIRSGIGLLGISLGIVAVALYFRWPMVADVWPWSGYYSSLTPLSYFFLSSIAAAVCAPVLWIAISDKLHAAAPGAINLLVAFIAISIFMFEGYAADPANTRLLQAALLISGVAVSSIVVYFLGRNMPIYDMRPLPAPVRYSFYVFIFALLLVGGRLILKTPNTLPWSVTNEASVVYGWIFIGASVYFIFAVVNPRWENAAGQLMGFLAYDVVLIGPFIRHFSDVQPEHLLSLTIYTSVVIYSGLLAIYYLFINRATRLFAGEEPARPSHQGG